jgi:hypothetical protein
MTVMPLRLFALIAALSAAGAACAEAGAPALSLPLACKIGSTCEVQHYVDIDPGLGARDYHGGRRTYDGHKGVDLRVTDKAAAGRTSVLAAAPGRVARLRDGMVDASVRATGAPGVKGVECGNGVVIDHGNGWETQYCHMARGSVTVKVGDTVKTGQPIGRVGLSGDTEFAHLHMQVLRNGAIVDPFAPGGRASPLWDTRTLRALAYKAGAVLNAGFAANPVDMSIENGAPPPPTRNTALVAYARAIGLERGDDVRVELRGPDGRLLAENRVTLDRDKAQQLLFAGRKLPAGGWPAGRYSARFEVRRAGVVTVARSFELKL